MLIGFERLKLTKQLTIDALFLGNIAGGCPGRVAALRFIPMGRYQGFAAPPPMFFIILPGIVLSYLSAVEATKQRV